MRTRYTTEGDVSRATSESTGRKPGGYGCGVESCPWVDDNSDPSGESLLEKVVEPANMKLAWKQVKRNGGSAGVDGRDIDTTATLLRTQWPELRQRILNGIYRPRPVLRVEIPKPGGGVRKLGIPTVVDRLVQQAVAQILEPIFDPTFSSSSYGFRRGRGAHDAVLQAREFQREGKRWVVDMDLKQFFDEVNHDVLMSRLGRKIKDKRLKCLINAFLKAGVQCAEGILPTDKGTPQGGPLSPLLSNILLDDLDKELENRGHRFCRYADDCNVYVSSRRAGDRVLRSITQFVEDTLKLKVNQAKSAVDRPWNRRFLGFSFSNHRSFPQIRVPDKTLKAFRSHLKSVFRKGRGRNLFRFINEDLNPILRGWLQYFALADTKQYAEELDGWIRHHLRCLIWRQWKRPKTRRTRLMRRGLNEERASTSAFNGRGAWWNSGASHMNDAFRRSFFDTLGLFNLFEHLSPRRLISTHGTAVVRNRMPGGVRAGGR